VRVNYGFEHDSRLRAGFIGCGGHAFRNVYPMLRYLPVELVAVCDVIHERAETFRGIFGAERAYTDYGRMLELERLDIVFIVVGYDGQRGSRLLHPELAAACLRQGLHVWVEKPPVETAEDVALLRAAVTASGCTYAVGFKKAFTPAIRRCQEILATADFGELRSLSLRYAQAIPTVADLQAGPGSRNFARLSFLDHLGHPLAILRLLAGPAQTLHYTRAANGSGFASFTMASGAVATLHLTSPLSMATAKERTEADGDGGTVVVENNIRISYHRDPRRPPIPELAGLGDSKVLMEYGRAAHFTGGVSDASLVWEPEFSLGQLYNKAEFLLGYYGELRDFCDAVRCGGQLSAGGLDYAEEGLRIFEGFAQGPNRVITL
jgi:predicted dehydrogenase